MAHCTQLSVIEQQQLVMEIMRMAYGSLHPTQRH